MQRAARGGLSARDDPAASPNWRHLPSGRDREVARRSAVGGQHSATTAVEAGAGTDDPAFWNVAQPVEHLAVNEAVAGSIPAIPANSMDNYYMIPVSDFGNVGRGADDFGAIMAAVSKCESLGGGDVLLHGGLHTSATIKLPQGVNLMGEGWHSSALASLGGSDISVVHMVSDTAIERLSIFGNMTSDSCADSVVRVMTGAVGGVIRDCRIWGGEWALATSGVDFDFDNCYIQGTGRNGGNIVSNGGAWYNRVKCDDSGHPHVYGFWQQWNGASDVAENHFVNSDFSGAFDVSVVIDDHGYSSNVTSFVNCVFSRPQYLNNAKWTSYNSCEFGADIFVGNGPCSIGTSLGFGNGITARGARVSSDCVNISA